jgi:uncharacterized protein (DUF2132 family)
LDTAVNDEINYKTNPLHGVSLKILLVELVNHYGFDILFAYLNINCFKINPSIESSVKFLKKTDWACEKVEAFYLYEFKNLPRASAEQFELSPRDRILPVDQKPGEPAELSLEDAERLREKRARKAEEWSEGNLQHSVPGKIYGAQRGSINSTDRKSSKPSNASGESGIDPWAKSRK